MSKKYTWSKTVDGETFTAVEFDSFDEAIKAVEKGVHDRQLSRPVQNPVSPQAPERGKIEVNGQDADHPNNPSANTTAGGNPPTVLNSDNGGQNINE